MLIQLAGNDASLAMSMTAAIHMPVNSDGLATVIPDPLGVVFTPLHGLLAALIIARKRCRSDRVLISQTHHRASQATKKLVWLSGRAVSPSGLRKRNIVTDNFNAKRQLSDTATLNCFDLRGADQSSSPCVFADLCARSRRIITCR